jgi:HSP20 family protein
MAMARVLLWNSPYKASSMKHLEIRKTKPPEAVRAVIQRGSMTPANAAFAGAREGSFAPPFEVREYSDHFVIKADVPGVRSADLSIFIHNDWIAVMGERPPHERKAPMSYKTYERTYGGFWRAFRLFPGISAMRARATLRNGVLSIHLPKAAASSDRESWLGHS